MNYCRKNKSVMEQPLRFMRSRLTSRAQAMIEFALIAPLVLVGLLVGIQYAVIGAGELALDQAAYQGARYASLNSSATQTDVKAALDTVVSPLIKSNYAVSTNPSTTRAVGTAVQVKVSWSPGAMIFLPNPFFYGINFPTSLSATESAFTE